MPFDLLFRLIEELFYARNQRRVETEQHDGDEPLEAWHSEADRLARTPAPYPGT